MELSVFLLLAVIALGATHPVVEDQPVDVQGSAAPMKDTKTTFPPFNMTGRLRCGVMDHGSSNKNSRFTLNGSRWRKQRITYRISQYSNSLPAALVDQVVARSFRTWEEVVELSFSQVRTGSADIDIRWTDGYGSGEYPFDGPGGVLALAIGAPKGFVHFDNSEQWSEEGNGVNLYQIAVHEIGHTLGLSHSEIYGAVMYPWAYGYDPNFSLHEDDIAGVQSLYQKRRTPIRTTTPPPSTSLSWYPETEDSELCADPSVDAILPNNKGEIYVFKGSVFYTVSSSGPVSSPRLISDHWPGLPSSIEAAFHYGATDKTYFVKGSWFWKYDTSGALVPGYPRRVSEGFPGVPDDIDTALVWTGNKKLYFFKGSHFWKFDADLNPPVPRNYPRPVSEWWGIPSGVEAAFVHRGESYFVKDDTFYRIADDTLQVVESGSLSAQWFGCRRRKTAPRNSMDWRELEVIRKFVERCDRICVVTLPSNSTLRTVQAVDLYVMAIHQYFTSQPAQLLDQAYSISRQVLVTFRSRELLELSLNKLL